MTNRELMKMARRALELRCNDADGNEVDLVTPAIKALRDRLAQPEPEPVAIGEEWKPCVKLPIVVHVREQRKGETHVSTREGITPVKEDDLIMRGVAGEEYPIGRELFNSTYTFDTAPVHAIDISQERVDETAKHRHEPVAKYMGKTYRCHVVNLYQDIPVETLLYTAPPKREWVGLEDETLDDVTDEFYKGAVWAEAKLKEKNA